MVITSRIASRQIKCLEPCANQLAPVQYLNKCTWRSLITIPKMSHSLQLWNLKFYILILWEHLLRVVPWIAMCICTAWFRNVIKTIVHVEVVSDALELGSRSCA